MARLRKHAIEPVKRPEMTFEPLAYEHPLEQFEKILQVAGASSVRLEAGQDVNEVIRSLYPEARSIASNLPGITCATVNPDLLEDPRELDGTDVAVIRGEFGVLENGMVWVKQQTRYKAADPLQGRVFYFRGVGHFVGPPPFGEQYARGIRPAGF